MNKVRIPGICGYCHIQHLRPAPASNEEPDFSLPCARSNSPDAAEECVDALRRLMVDYETGVFAIMDGSTDQVTADAVQLYLRKLGI